jgi:hypothetical protein
MLSPNGELLPLGGANGYMAFNTTTVVDALNLKNSRIRYFKSDPNKILHIDQYEFCADELAGATIFRARYCRATIFVTDVFVQRVRRCALNGFIFKKVWPLPYGANYRKLYNEQKRSAAMVIDHRG